MFGNRSKVCQFFLEGRCRYGDKCNFEHPSNQSQNQNRFAPLSNQPRGRSNAFGSNSQDNTADTFAVTADSIKLELTDERPIWPLSCYGPGRGAPRQLLDAEFEQSPEEMRVLHYAALASGNAQETSQREASTAEAVNAAIQKILADINGAVKYVVDGKDQHPNRIDMSKVPFGSKENATPSQTSAFGAQSQISSFGQPSSFGRNTQTSTFGQPSASGQGTSFGQPSSLGNTAFGQPSNPGQTSAFGQPSNLGQTSAFGQPSGLGQNSAFGKPSALGSAPAFGQPAFGQPSQPSGFAQAASQAPAFGQSGFASTNTAQQSTFGQPSAFGSAAKAPSPFASAASGTQNQQSSSFGQPSAFGAAARQASPFATAAAGQQQTSSFGQPSAFGAAAAKPSPFATAANSANGQQTTGAFGQPSAFGAAANKPSPFATAAPSQPHTGAAAPAASPFGAQQRQQSNAFGAPSSTQNQNTSPFAQNTTQPVSAFGQPSQPVASSPFAAAPQQNNNTLTTGTKQPAAHLSRDGAGRLTAFKGQPVIHDDEKKTHTARNPSTGNEERIWFPDGVSLPHKDAQAPEELYEGELGQALEKLYLYVKDNGVFENGLMPEIPPKCEWVAFDI